MWESRGKRAARWKEKGTRTANSKVFICNFKFEMLNAQLCSPSSKQKAGRLELIQVKSLILKPEVA